MFKNFFYYSQEIIDHLFFSQIALLQNNISSTKKSFH